MQIAVIDYGVGNVGSVLNSLNKIAKQENINIKAQIQKDASKLKQYDKVFLPGVGAFSHAMDKLKSSNMDEAVKEFVKSGKYVIGMCLGMHVMLDTSYEFGKHKGLGLIEGEVVKFDKTKFDTNTKIKIPHMGWNTISAENTINKNDEIFKSKDGFISNPYLYFVHSYHVKCKEKYVLAKSTYGYEFTSAIKKDNVYGFQPHLEKSSDVGLDILSNFMRLK